MVSLQGPVPSAVVLVVFGAIQTGINLKRFWFCQQCNYTEGDLIDFFDDVGGMF